MLILLCVTFDASATRYGNIYGCCKKLHDRTVIISVFANDTITTWNWRKQVDYNQYAEPLRRVGMDVKWIRKEAAACDTRMDLLWDFMNTPYLYAEATFNLNMQKIEGSVYEVYQKWIDENGHIDFMKRYFGTKSIIYAFPLPMPMNCCTVLAVWTFIAPSPSSICRRSSLTGTDPPTRKICTL